MAHGGWVELWVSHFWLEKVEFIKGISSNNEDLEQT